jgi:uncharacterized protein
MVQRMVERPRTDEDIRRFCRELGIPGLIDAHVHVMPPRVEAKVWAYFDSAGPLTGRPWPIEYRWSRERRLAHLRSIGVRAFPSLVYAHKPGMAQWLNSWARDLAEGQRRDGHDDLVQTATFFPEPGATAYVQEALDEGARIFKAHVQVGGYDPRDPLLDEVWGTLSDADVPVVVHTGSGPAPGSFTGPGPFGEVLARHPRLAAVIAHMGMPEYDEFLTLAERHERVHLDTTMAFVDFFGAEEQTALARHLAPRLAGLQDRIVLGTDFPSIPYPYAHQLEALQRTGLGEEWLRAVCWDNGARLLGVDSRAMEPTTGA